MRMWQDSYQQDSLQTAASMKPLPIKQTNECANRCWSRGHLRKPSYLRQLLPFGGGWIAAAASLGLYQLKDKL